MRPLALCLAAALGCATPALADATRTVTDDTGRQVTIPDTPARIVVLHEPLLGVPVADLGVAPVGTYVRQDDGSPGMSVDFYAEVLGTRAPQSPGFGAAGSPDLEKLRALAPDLIVGIEHQADLVAPLEKIAPVYLQNVSTGKVHGFGVELALAAVLNQGAALDARLAAYRARLDATRAVLPDTAGKTYLAVVLTDQVNAVGDMSGAVQALEDLGYSRLTPGGETPIKGMGSTLLVPLSPEVFGQMNPDLLVVLNTYNAEGRDAAGARAALDQLLPGWEVFLTPAREGRLIFMDSGKVTTPSIASAEHALDAIAAWAKGGK
ncbi:ABC transporter substrate-binding protein [Paracoccus sp. p3-h83]|uniref:ABC transporter substrate-binding protein n=1 Tax=Paracoccus sp. p3-h83 TaxID=3342805 RepID=UPI0035B7779B